MGNLDISAEAFDSEITTDSNGFRHKIFRSQTNDLGNSLTILVKSREDLPVYEQATSGDTIHLGSPPRIIPEAESQYHAWLETISQNTGSPGCHYIVDATPLGAIRLSLIFQPNPALEAIAEQMEAGQYSPEAISLVDSFSAIYLADPAQLPVIEQATRDFVSRNAELNNKMYHAFDALLTGDFDESIDGELRKIVESARSNFVENTEIEPVSEQLRELLRVLHDQDCVDEFSRQVAGLIEEGTSGIPYQLRQATDTINGEFRVRRKAITQDTSRTKGALNADRNPESVITLARALAGDPAAHEQVQLALDTMNASDTLWDKLRAQNARNRIFNSKVRPGIDIDDLVLVHATKFEPQFDENGLTSIHTRQDTQGYPRASLHFTLNHRITSHNESSWDAAAYTIVAPMNEAINLNGTPSTLCGIDTWWNCNPGEPVVLPNAVLVADGGNIEPLRIRNDNRLNIKTGDFNEKDVLDLFNQSVESRNFSEFRKLFQETKTTPANIEMLKLFDQTIESERDSARLDEEAVQQIREKLDTLDLRSTQVQNSLAEINRTHSVNGVIHELGGPVFEGDEWATNHEDEISEVAMELGVIGVHHTNTPESHVEEFGIGWWAGKPMVESWGDIDNLPIEARRALMVSSVTVVAEPPVVDRSRSIGG